jgi:hypothetical protein
MIVLDFFTLNSVALNDVLTQVIQVENQQTISENIEPLLDGQRSQNNPHLCPPNRLLSQTDLYFGRNIGTAGRVTERQFRRFLESTVMPRFPVGTTVYNASGQFLDRSQTLIREPSKVLNLMQTATTENQQAVNDIIGDYKQRFQQQSVLQVTNSDITVNCGQGTNLIKNDPTPEFIQVDLYFGNTTQLLWNPCFEERFSPSQLDCNLGNMGQVSDRQFRHFLATEVTPRFPNGLTVYDTKTLSLNRHRDLTQESANVVALIFEDSAENEERLEQLIDVYQDQFQEESVLEVVNEEIKVGFGQGEDVIENDATPELIQVDLYFGQNIGKIDRVSDRQFRQFLRDEITPRFPDGLTVYNADGQYLDQSKRLIRESSKVVSLVLEDTQMNERSLNQIIAAYRQTFQQESVLVVVDETLEVWFK